MTTFYKKIIPTFLVVALAVLTGLVIGKMYLDANSASSESKYTFAEIHASREVVEDLYNQSLVKDVKDFTAKQLYLIAEYKLSNSDFTIDTTGIIDSGVMGISAKVSMHSVKTKVGNKLTYAKFSPPESVGPGIKTPKICKQFTYDLDKKGIDGKPYINIVEGAFTFEGSTPANPAEIDGVFTGRGDNMSEEDFIKQFKALPNQSILPYIISDMTFNGKPEVTDNADGTYTFVINLSGHDVLKEAAVAYSKEIAYTCGYGNANLTWKDLSMTVVIGSDFNFKSIVYNEKYALKATGLPMNVQKADVNDIFTSVFSISEVA